MAHKHSDKHNHQSREETGTDSPSTDEQLAAIGEQLDAAETAKTAETAPQVNFAGYGYGYGGF